MTRDAKSIRVRCGTWDQVEAFYNEKVQASRGNILVVKMPFRPGIGEPMTVALGLPDGLVFAIDGTVVKIGADDAGRVPVAVRLHGLSAEVRAQLKRLVAQGRGQASAPTTPVGGTRAVGTKPPPSRPPPVRVLIETVPPPSDPSLRDVTPDEREIFDGLAATRERVSALPAHEVLGVAAETTGETLKSAYLAAAHEVHPDRFRRYRSPALRLLASDVFVLVRRAYERMASIEGPARQEGWLLAMPDASEGTAPAGADTGGVPTETLQVAGSAPYSEISISTPAVAGPASYEEDVSFTTSVRMRALTAEELFDDEPTLAPMSASSQTTPVPPASAQPAAAPPRTEAQELEASARAALAEGRFREACEGFASFLRQDPRNRVIRALYHVASGLDLRAKGEGVKARLQFETALAHDRDCEEARRALAHNDPERAKTGIFKRLFDK